MNEQNLLSRMANLVAGSTTLLREVPVPLSSLIASGASATALSSNVAIVTLDADNESVSFPIRVPWDYDADRDKLAVGLVCRLTTGDMSGEAEYVALDLDQVNVARMGESDVTDLSSSVTSNSQNPDDEAITEYVWDLSGLGIKPGDALTVEIDAQSTGSSTPAVTVYGAFFRYASDIVAYDKDTREAVTNAITN